MLFSIKAIVFNVEFGLGFNGVLNILFQTSVAEMAVDLLSL